MRRLNSLCLKPMALGLLGLFCSQVSTAATVAIIDSGIDYKHEFLQDRMWINPVDQAFDNTDTDNNGYVDDVYGWNFFNRSPHVIDYKYNDIYNSQIQRFFELQTSILLGQATEADMEWFQGVMQDRQFVRDAMTFANFVHGTHVAGISAQPGNDVKVMAIRLIPTENPLFNLQQDVELSIREGQEFNWIVKQIIKGGLYLLAKTQAMVFDEVAAYLDQHKVDVANASLGVSATQMRQILTPLLKLANRGKEPPVELVDEILVFFLERLNIEQAVMMRKAPNTLFVFAAGNDGISNDKFPTAPASIQHPHVISVAATHAGGQIAKFSNFGMRVDIAADGVAIQSSIPNDLYMALSGTSQAAPLVSGVAGEIKAINPQLGIAEIKKIIMTSVDKRAELAGLVKAGGLLNPERSLKAAELSLEMPLDQAMDMARQMITDIDRTRAETPKTEGTLLPLLPPFLF
ncbi:MAG: S8 family serine peptidase [Oligoflexus sp.]